MLYETARKIERNLRWPVVALCQYEAIALMLPKNKYTPPISVLARKHKWFILLFCAIFSVHAWFLED